MKILVITDFDSTGSGYKNICGPLLTGLSLLGYEIKVEGLMYKGDEHSYPFSIIPVATPEDSQMMAQNLIALWHPDVVMVALDIPLQIKLFSTLAPYLARTPEEISNGFSTPRKYFCITPLENGPLTMSWAANMFGMDAVFFISELGKQEAQKVGISKAEHLLVGSDTVSWYPANPEEKERIREGLGIPKDAFVMLTVADNQERKNLWAGMEITHLLKENLDVPVRYIIVTREQSPFGWRLRDLAVLLGINSEYVSFERGLPQRDLWGLYAIADVYLQPSKAEGLGLPVLDAMATGIPVVATDTGALHELLEDGRGFLAESAYSFIDVWGNSRRDMISIEDAAQKVLSIAKGGGKEEAKAALDYARSRTWNISVQQVHEKIQELCNVKK